MTPVILAVEVDAVPAHGKIDTGLQVPAALVIWEAGDGRPSAAMAGDACKADGSLLQAVGVVAQLRVARYHPEAFREGVDATGEVGVQRIDTLSACLSVRRAVGVKR